MLGVVRSGAVLVVESRCGGFLGVWGCRSQVCVGVRRPPFRDAVPMSEKRKPKGRIDEIGDESRRRILDAAEALFAEKGFDRTSFADLAARSGLSRGSIPWHFQNTDGLLTAAGGRGVCGRSRRGRYGGAVGIRAWDGAADEDGGKVGGEPGPAPVRSWPCRDGFSFPWQQGSE